MAADFERAGIYVSFLFETDCNAVVSSWYCALQLLVATLINASLCVRNDFLFSVPQQFLRQPMACGESCLRFDSRVGRPLTQNPSKSGAFRATHFGPRPPTVEPNTRRFGIRSIVHGRRFSRQLRQPILWRINSHTVIGK